MSPKTSKQFQAIREESRNKIMLAALKLFARKGYHNTSIDAIAKEAKVAKGLLYNYFDGKRDLLDQIIMSAMQEGEGYFNEMDKYENPKEKLKFLIDESFAFMLKRPDYTKLLTSLAMQLEDFPEYVELFNQRYKFYMPLFSQLLQSIGIPDHENEARATAAMLDGIGVQYMILGNEQLLKEMKQVIYSKFNLSEDIQLL